MPGVHGQSCQSAAGIGAGVGTGVGGAAGGGGGGAARGTQAAMASASATATGVRDEAAGRGSGYVTPTAMPDARTRLNRSGGACRNPRAGPTVLRDMIWMEPK